MVRIGRRVYFMSNQINMLPFLLEAFAENKNLYRDIDALYMQDKYKFYKLAKLSSLYNHPIICKGDIMRQECDPKTLGILLKKSAPPLSPTCLAVNLYIYHLSRTYSGC